MRPKVTGPRYWSDLRRAGNTWLGANIWLHLRVAKTQAAECIYEVFLGWTFFRPESLQNPGHTFWRSPQQKELCLSVCLSSLSLTSSSIPSHLSDGVTTCFFRTSMLTEVLQLSGASRDSSTSLWAVSCQVLGLSVRTSQTIARKPLQ